jgi:hypothetical protein
MGELDCNTELQIVGAGQNVRLSSLTKQGRVVGQDGRGVEASSVGIAWITKDRIYSEEQKRGRTLRTTNKGPQKRDRTAEEYSKTESWGRESQNLHHKVSQAASTDRPSCDTKNTPPTNLKPKCGDLMR